MKFTLKDMAEAGYVMGLSTIGEVANHMECHYDAYFTIEDVANHTGDYALFCESIAGHENDSIDLYITDEDKKKMDDELDKAMAMAPGPDPAEFAKDCEGFIAHGGPKAKDEEPPMT